ncbi:hypothetical protein H257_02171 [Aphanomyces astaci]|uniref:Peptidase M24 domain-containing protein n=1 Tax=Aphanomyces astaci TaxID=112090 RepID=W4H7U5_APHAT|nr:hypothetical protein H257_02171 [Aphanomyces astaci]ETV87198.1 hypothetical protein H257_02171 [Aphanomyces astaci]|eukprot:XP_009823997.1 hypothetical protein H257_02171 [Aphanomyces astaci]
MQPPSPPYHAPFNDLAGSDVHEGQVDFVLKVEQVRGLLVKLNADAGVLSLAHNFAWITGGGRNHIFQATEGGVGSIYIDATRVVLITNNIEGHRLKLEELSGLDLEVFEEPWHMCQSVQAVATSIANGSSVQFDTDGSFDNALAPLRQALTPLDIRRFRQLGHDCTVHTHVRPGLTEWAIGAAISQACVARGIDMVFLLKAADDRVDAIRHPLPTTNVLHHKAMLVLCDTRIPDDLRKRHDAVTFVDAAALAATAAPLAISGYVFRAIQAAYTSTGFANEYTLHHQGGGTGYKSREWKATPTSEVGAARVFPVEIGQVCTGLVCVSRMASLQTKRFYWNPSIAGTKSEDTVLLVEGGGRIEVLTADGDWPQVRHTMGEITYSRPDILHIQVDAAGNPLPK